MSRTLTFICFEKFIKDLKEKKCPESLQEQYNNIAIHAKAYGEKTSDYFTIKAFREIFSIRDVTKIISVYKSKEPEQLNLEL